MCGWDNVISFVHSLGAVIAFKSLLSDVGATSVLAMEIQGAAYECSTIVGVRESVLEISLVFSANCSYHEWQDTDMEIEICYHRPSKQHTAVQTGASKRLKPHINLQAHLFVGT